MYKIKYLFIVSLIGFASLSVVYGQSIKGDTLRVLAIGNSFSEDAVEQYLHELADAAGKKIVIGNLYIGGAPLSLHWKNIQEGNDVYRYRKITADGVKSTSNNISILTVLQSEAWDYISLQQASRLSGKFDTYIEPLRGIKHFLDSAEGANVKYIWHQTWAYAPNSTHSGFANYGRDQQQMYRAIMKASARAKKKFHFDLLVPSGTAIQNARTTFLGDNLTRDGYHLNFQIGRFIAACAWFESLFGEEAPIDRYHPEKVRSEEAEVAKQAAHAAVRNPFKVTKFNYKPDLE